MTVQQLCAALMTLQKRAVDETTEGTNVISDDLFPDVLTEKWLKDNLQDLFENYNTKGSREDALTGNLEINAFLASFQKAAEASRRGRLTRWAAIYSEKNRLIAAEGPLTRQLMDLGVKVDDPFVTMINDTDGGSAVNAPVPVPAALPQGIV